MRAQILLAACLCLLACDRTVPPPEPKKVTRPSPPPALTVQDHTAAKRALLESAEKALKTQDFAGALAILNRFAWLKGDPDAAALRQRITKEEERTRPAREARARKAQAAADKMARVAYAAVLRERFLEEGLDIKVKVLGNNADRLDLQFALFNDVWLHRFRKGDLIQEIWKLGFTRIDFRDGFDYHMYLTLE